MEESAEFTPDRCNFNRKLRNGSLGQPLLDGRWNPLLQAHKEL